jgi:hypothetical protein
LLHLVQQAGCGCAWHSLIARRAGLSSVSDGSARR